MSERNCRDDLYKLFLTLLWIVSKSMGCIISRRYSGFVISSTGRFNFRHYGFVITSDYKYNLAISIHYEKYKLVLTDVSSSNSSIVWSNKSLILWTLEVQQKWRSLIRTSVFVQFISYLRFIRTVYIDIDTFGTVPFVLVPLCSFHLYTGDFRTMPMIRPTACWTIEICCFLMTSKTILILCLTWGLFPISRKIRLHYGWFIMNIQKSKQYTNQLLGCFIILHNCNKTKLSQSNVIFLLANRRIVCYSRIACTMQSIQKKYK